MENVQDSILQNVKKMLGLETNYTPFDQELTIYINSALFTLMQLGVGPSEGFDVDWYDQTWTDFLGDQLTQLKAVKEYVYLSVRLVFDPPNSSSVIKAFEDRKKELEWRLRHQTEAGDDM